MGNCRSIKVGDCSPQRKITLAIFGLDNAGKTLTTKGLLGESATTVAPTIGFSNVSFSFHHHKINLFDLGGGSNIRNIWKNYFAEIYGLIYVIDASDHARLLESKKELLNLISHELVLEKPLLILANKQDVKEALDKTDICIELDLENLVNIYKIPCMLKCCSAFVRSNKQIDNSIKLGFEWLIGAIDLRWEKLHDRVTKDVKIKQEKELLEKQKRSERVRKSREASEAPDYSDDCENDRDFSKKHNPFVPVKK